MDKCLIRGELPALQMAISSSVTRKITECRYDIFFHMRFLSACSDVQQFTHKHKIRIEARKLSQTFQKREIKKTEEGPWWHNNEAK